MIANNTETVEWTTQARGGLGKPPTRCCWLSMYVSALCAVAEGNMDEANELLAALDRKSEDPVIQLAISKVLPAAAVPDATCQTGTDSVRRLHYVRSSWGFVRSWNWSCRSI